MKEIPLTQGMVALVDDEDYDELMKYKWHALKSRGGYYAARIHYVYMHRQILGFPDSKIDHRNRKRLHNYKSNLRPATKSQNAANSRRSVANRNKHGFKGIRLKAGAKEKPWSAQIKCMYAAINLGYYPTKRAAARAYDDAAVRLFGEFALLNFPQRGKHQTQFSPSVERKLKDLVRNGKGGMTSNPSDGDKLISVVSDPALAHVVLQALSRSQAAGNCRSTSGKLR